MIIMNPLEKAIRIILLKCLNLQNDETLLLLSDGSNPEFCRTALALSPRLKLKSALLEIVLNQHPYQEPPDFVAKMMTLADAILLITQTPISRSAACQLARAHNARMLSLVNLQPNTLNRIIQTRYSRLKAITQKLADILTIGSKLTLTSELGSDFQLSLIDVQGLASTGLAAQPGQISSLPAGEAYCMPVSCSGEGEVYVDGSIESLGPLDAPVYLKIATGMIKRISGGNAADKLSKYFKNTGPVSRQLIGFGMGTNELAQFGLSADEDKKVLGTVHLSFGNLTQFDKNERYSHRLDVVLKHPTVTIDGKTIIENGNLMLNYH